ncbi:hypothetical protein ACOME3_008123 [Neoechinorhynchus agilis]
MSKGSRNSDNIQWNSYLLQLQQSAPQPVPVLRKTDHRLPKGSFCHALPYGNEYHGTISRNEAENILKDRPDGAYLVRQSCNPPGSFTLAIRFNGETKNYKLFFDEVEKKHYVGEKRFDDLCKDSHSLIGLRK